MFLKLDADRLDNYGLFEAFNLTNCKIGQNTSEKFLPNRVEYRDMHFNEKIFNECEDNTNFSGNFQTEKYFVSSLIVLEMISLFVTAILNPVKSLLIVLEDVISASSFMFAVEALV